MQTEILTVGRLKEGYLKQGIAEYSKRLQPTLPLTIREVKDEAVAADAAAALISKAKEQEGARLLALIDDDAWVVALDLQGKSLSSEQLAAQMLEWQCLGRRRLIFVIGGSYGLAPAVLQRADYRLCFGPMTFPHQLMRLILVEQIYRAGKINRGETYHK